MKYPCELITDLLPMYCSNLCSAPSQEIVREHLASCDECSKVFKQIDIDMEISENEVTELTEEVLYLAQNAASIRDTILASVQKTALQ